MNSIKIFISLAILCVPCIALADIYKCDRDGQTVWADRPCEPEAESVEVDGHTPYRAPAGLEGPAAQEFLDVYRAAQEAAAEANRKSWEMQYKHQKTMKGIDRIEGSIGGGEDPGYVTAGRVTAAMQRGDVVQGMTVEQVTKTWGAPESKRPSGDSEQWSYYGKNGTARSHVYIRDGVVTSVSRHGINTTGKLRDRYRGPDD